MADQATPAPATEAPAASEAATTPNAAQPTGDATGPNGGTQAQAFTQADVERIVKERLDRQAAKLAKDAETAEATRQQKQLEEQGKYKEVADALQAKLAAAEQARVETERKFNQREAAIQTKLPAALADRLKGDTLDEMVADAKAIMAALPKPEAPNINASNGAGGAPGPGQLDEAEKQRIADKYGVNPKYM